MGFQNKILGPVAAPELGDVVNKIKIDLSANINCVQVATIVSYDATANTCSCQINYKRKLDDGRIFDYPVMSDCPVFFLSGGTSWVSMPISAGDTCIVLFNDRDLDNWWYSGQSLPPASYRTHSLSDGMVLVGVRNQVNALPLKDNVIEMFGGLNKIAIGNGFISLKMLIDTLIDTIVAITVGPTSIPLSAASVVQLNLVKAQFALLLDQGSSP